jgi:DNA-binding transcriptional LysR family regulator
MSIELNQLETFVAVAELKSFSRAAERLHRTQPAISQVIRKLEDDIGETLFDRALRDGSLTAAGELLHGYALRLLQLRGEAGLALDELRSLDRGRLMLAANEYTCLYLLPVLDQFRRLYPQIPITVQRAFASRIPNELAARSAEFGVLSFVPDPATFRSISVYQDRMAVVVKPGHPLSRKKRIRIQDLGSESFVAHNADSPLRQRVFQTFKDHQTPLNIGIELPSMEAVKRFVAHGNGVAIVPGLTAAQELASGELVGIEVPELSIERELRLILRRKAVLSYVGAAFLKVVEQYAQEHGAPYLFAPESEHKTGAAPASASEDQRAATRPAVATKRAPKGRNEPRHQAEV